MERPLNASLLPSFVLEKLEHCSLPIGQFTSRLRDKCRICVTHGKAGKGVYFLVIPEIGQVMTIVICRYGPILTAQVDCSNMVISKSINQISMAGQVYFGPAHAMAVQIPQVEAKTTMIGWYAFLFEQI